MRTTAAKTGKHTKCKKDSRKYNSARQINTVTLFFEIKTYFHFISLFPSNKK
jgi:hypothetical protein